MKIEILEGCTTFNTFFDDVSIKDVDKEKIIDYLLPKIKEAVLKDEISLNHIVELFQNDDYEDLGYCEQCEDHSSKTTYNI